MASSLPTTKDILGEHLHYKVSELLDTFFASHKKNVHYGKVEPVDKITGMLLERSINEIKEMLSDQMTLMKYIHKALAILLLDDFQVENESSISSLYDDIGELLFCKIGKLESNNVPLLTGMLLEQEEATLLHLLQDDNLLKVAVGKAKASLLYDQTGLSHDAGDSMTSVSGTSNVNNSEPDLCQTDNWIQCVGDTVYSQVNRGQSDFSKIGLQLKHMSSGDIFDRDLITTFWNDYALKVLRVLANLCEVHNNENFWTAVTLFSYRTKFCSSS